MDKINRLNEYLYNYSDPRTKDWPLVTDVAPISLISIGYILFVYALGPALMKSRPAFELKNILAYYNIAQILSCAVVVYWLLVAGWTTKFHLGCMPIDLAVTQENIQLAGIFWWLIILKIAELAETVFFILRKKENQVSGLHVYHHVSTLILAWIGCKFYPGPMATFPILLNSIVHIVMYGYYYLTSLGGEVSQKINKFKKYITIMQMVQFTMILMYASQALMPTCEVPKGLALIFIPDVIVVFYLFYDFYKKSYTEPQKPKTKLKKKKT
nr:PREDICTED: elongation of very long chain fatty acids protein AAEL008004-like [Bemisia tabaci]